LQDAVPALTALVQSYGLHDNLIDQNIGGIVCGLELTPYGVKWQSDTAFVLYNSPMEAPEIIFSFIRDNALVVHSSLTKETRVLMNSAVPKWEDWLRKWNPTVDRQIKTDHYPVAIFIRREDKLITVISRLPQKEDGQVKLEDGKNGTVLLTLGSSLLQHLARELGEPIEAGTLPFLLTFLYDQ
jgi:hypothetical protein